IMLTGYFTFVGDVDLAARPVVAQVIKDQPAEKAGFKVGDEITAINGKPMSGWRNVLATISGAPNKELRFTVLRDGRKLELNATPALSPEELPVWGPDFQDTGKKARQGRIGLAQQTVHKPIPLSDAVVKSVEAPRDMLVGLARLF